MDNLHITTSVRIYPLILKTRCVLWLPSCVPWSPQGFTKCLQGLTGKKKRLLANSRPPAGFKLYSEEFSLSPFMCVFVRTKSQDKKRWKTKAVRSPGSSLITITNSNLLWGPRNSILNSRMAFNYVRSLKLRIFPSLHMKWKQS